MNKLFVMAIFLAILYGNVHIGLRISAVSIGTSVVWAGNGSSPMDGEVNKP